MVVVRCAYDSERRADVLVLLGLPREMSMRSESTMADSNGSR
jgi:hypothetical protein